MYPRTCTIVMDKVGINQKRLSPDVIRVTKTRRMNEAGRVSCVRDEEYIGNVTWKGKEYTTWGDKIHGTVILKLRMAVVLVVVPCTLAIIALKCW